LCLYPFKKELGYLDRTTFIRGETPSDLHSRCML
jgi:hypothetical protein